MPKPSSNPDRAIQGGGGVEAGVYLVKEAKYQNLKSDFKANQPHLVLTCTPCTPAGEPQRAAEDVEIRWGFGEKAAAHFHPGIGKGPDDLEPVNQGDGVDVEGNTIYCEGSEQFSRSSAYIVFTESLV